MIVTTRISKFRQDIYRKNSAYLKVIYDLIDGLEFRVAGTDTAVKDKLDALYYREMQIMGAVTNRDYIQISDRFVVRLDYLPSADAHDIIYTFCFVLCAGYTEMGRVERFDLGEDWGLISAGDSNIILNLFDPEHGCNTYTSMYEMVRRYKLMELDLEDVPEVPVNTASVKSVNGMAYHRALPPNHTPETRFRSDKSIRINIGGLSMPFDAWKKRLDCNRDDLAELLTIDMDEPIEVPTMPRRTNAYQSRDERFYEVNGRSMTLTQWSKYAHISKKLLAKRIDDGMTMEEAITTPTETRSLRPHKPREVMYYTYRGETRTLYQWSEILGVSEGKLRKRIEAKLPPKKVMLPAPRHRVIYVKGNEPTLPRKKGYIVAEEEERKRKEREERDRKRLEALNGDQQS